MSDRIHVTMALDLFVEDAEEMRRAAFERLRSAWSSDEDFPYESEADVPLDEVVHSLLADALPADLHGCRRSQLQVEVEEESGDDSQAPSEGESDATNPSDAARSDEGAGDVDDSGAEPQSTTGETDDSQASASDEDEAPVENRSSDESSNSDRRTEGGADAG